MKFKLPILLVSGILGLTSFLGSQTNPEGPSSDTTPLTPQQENLFDRLLEEEIRRSPESAQILQEDPVEAAEMVEISEEESPAVIPVKSQVTGTFIQLTKKWTTLSEEDWSKILDMVEYAGMTKIIIQWTALETIAYFEPAPEVYTETYPVINRLFSALEGRDIEVILGLSHDPKYWKNIETRNDVRDVYFRVRNTHNLRVQESLLEEFGSVEGWTGYYISEEIDDINWREPANEEVLHQFLLRSGRIIRERDEERTISISSFFRKRTAPSTYANNLVDLMTATEINQLWVQDGIGVFPMSSSLMEPYYKALRTRFSGQPTNPGVVVELFETTSEPDEPFAAQPALAARVENQLKDASLLGGPIVVFSLFDYADPRNGGNARDIYEQIRKWNLSGDSLLEGTQETAVEPLPEAEVENVDSAGPLDADTEKTDPPSSPAPENIEESEMNPASEALRSYQIEEAPRIEPLTGLRIPFELLPPPANPNRTTPQESPNP